MADYVKSPPPDPTDTRPDDAETLDVPEGTDGLFSQLALLFAASGLTAPATAKPPKKLNGKSSTKTFQEQADSIFKNEAVRREHGGASTADPGPCFDVTTINTTEVLDPAYYNDGAEPTLTAEFDRANALDNLTQAVEIQCRGLPLDWKNSLNKAKRERAKGLSKELLGSLPTLGKRILTNSDLATFKEQIEVLTNSSDFGRG